MKDFEQCLAQFEPMISATIRKLHVYRDFEQFRQVGRIALWQAWQRYDVERGDFAPYAASSIRGAMLDLLKQEHHFETHVMQAEDDTLMDFLETQQPIWNEDTNFEQLAEVMKELSFEERQFIHWYYVERISQKACAARLGISIPGVKKKRQRLLKKMRCLIEQKGLQST